MRIKKYKKPTEVIKMFKKIIGSLIVSSALFVGVNNAETDTVKDVELQKAINYAPIIKEEFKAINDYQAVNVNDNSDVIELNDITETSTPVDLVAGKTYTVSFKNDYPIKIK